MVNKSPVHFYTLYVSGNLLNVIVSATNKYAAELIAKKPDVSSGARINQWVPTSVYEIKKLFGLLLFMGVVKVPKLSDYRSKDEVIGQRFPRTIMSRNRFEILFRMLHFSKMMKKTSPTVFIV